MDMYSGNYIFKDKKIRTGMAQTGRISPIDRPILLICFIYVPTHSANLAQLVEHFIRNEEVVGSTPIVGSTAK